MILIVTVSAFGLIILVNHWNTDTTEVANNANLSGITTSGEIFNGTNSTLHGMTDIMPNFIWIIFIFLLVVFLTIFAIALKRH